MATPRKTRTARFTRDDALARAVASTRLEGGSLSDDQRRLIERYQAGELSADDVTDRVVSAAQTEQ
ncbi:hypothetical protein ABID81_000412 [Frigoribacterium sp. PvP054]|uniref:antitoxin VbhA family protein n=1 Tax=unclassified Frigoribacterium TaxID=2627005 RepID=UPI0006F7CEF4|nr:antitoxin VbhA family protein [Frigoribacterium sp. Leaf186]KQS22757.1 hypothetical protein ASG05_04375 [Frigoribacterium sp. Leaf186]MBF4600176.1 antitoxin VbhA family protein [Frigoribacterium sp. VKM Ac-1396]